MSVCIILQTGDDVDNKLDEILILELLASGGKVGLVSLMYSFCLVINLFFMTLFLFLLFVC